jgi:hypothetical protein
MSGEAFEPVEVDMGRSAGNNITQAGGCLVHPRQKTYDPTDDIEAMRSTPAVWSTLSCSIRRAGRCSVLSTQ